MENFIAIRGKVLSAYSGKLSDEDLEVISAEKLIINYELDTTPSTTALTLRIPADRHNSEETAGTLEVIMTPGLHLVIGGSGSGKTTLVDDILYSLINGSGEFDLTKGSGALASKRVVVDKILMAEPMAGMSLSIPRILDAITAMGDEDSDLRVLMIDSLSAMQDLPELGAPGKGGVPKSLMNMFSCINDYASTLDVIVISPFNVGGDESVSNTVFNVASGSSNSALLMDNYKVLRRDHRFGSYETLMIERDESFNISFRHDKQQKNIVNSVRFPKGMNADDLKQFMTCFRLDLSRNDVSKIEGVTPEQLKDTISDEVAEGIQEMAHSVSKSTSTRGQTEQAYMNLNKHM